MLSGRLKVHSVEITTLYPHGSSVTPGLGNRFVFFFFSFLKVDQVVILFTGWIPGTSLTASEVLKPECLAGIAGFSSNCEANISESAAAGSTLGIGRLLRNSISEREGEQPGY